MTIKKGICSFLLALIIVLPAFTRTLPNNVEDKPAPLNILSYNIHHCNPPSREGYIDMEAIARVIGESGADLVALQEVDVHTERSGKAIHQARELARLTGMYYYFAKNIDYQGGEYGNAVLSKYPIVDSMSYKLPMDPEAGGEPRGVAVVKVKLPGGKQVLFGSVHLDLKPANKKLQAGALNRLFGNGTLPVILAGDFNAQPDTEPIAILDKQWKRTCTEDCGFTIPVIQPRRTIDYIMFKQNGALISIAEHRVINETYASDHLPVFAKLHFTK